MLSIRNYVRPQTIEEAYEYAKKPLSVVLGGMLWLKMQNRNVNFAIDLSDLHLDQIEEIDDDRLDFEHLKKVMGWSPKATSFRGAYNDEGKCKQLFDYIDSIVNDTYDSDAIKEDFRQIEIDAAYEGIHYLSLFEAKRDLSDDFLVRQLYYPFRVWSERVTKTVKPVFLIFSTNLLIIILRSPLYEMIYSLFFGEDPVYFS